MKLNSLLTLFGVLLLTSCISGGKPDNFDYGKVENGVYTNSFFNCELTLPENWVVQSNEQVNEMMQIGEDLFVGDDENMRRVIKASEINSAVLVVAFEYELGSTVEYNPNIVIMVENLSNAPGVKSGKDYLFHSQRLLSQSSMSYNHIDDNFEEEKIGGAIFYKMGARISVGDIEVHQTYYSTVLNGFSFSIIISYAFEEQREELLNSMSSLKFNGHS